MMDTLMKLLGLSGSFETLAAIGLLVMALEEVIDRFWNLDGKWSQLRTLVIGMALGDIGAFFNLGMFSDPNCCGTVPDLWCGMAIGFTAACVANVAFLTPLAKAFLELIKVRPKEDAASKTAPVTSDAGTKPQ